MKVFTVLSLCVLLTQLSHQAPGHINYRFLNLTKPQNTEPADDDYYYDEELVPSSSQSPIKDVNNIELSDDYYDEPSTLIESTATSTTTTSTTTISTTTKLNNFNYYDEYDNLDYENYDYSESKDPYTCPSKCKCSFKKVAKNGTHRRSLDNGNDYTYEYSVSEDYEKTSIKLTLTVQELI